MGPIRITAARLSAGLLLATLVSACAVMPARQQVAAVEMPGQLEAIHAAALTKDLAVFWVSSNGCTQKGDLQPVVVNHRGDASVITLRRIAEDRCQTPLDDGVELMWSFEELGIKPGAQVSVDNPYQMPQS